MTVKDGENRAALYARVSTMDQDPEPQLERMRAWAHNRGFDVEREVVEQASGRDGNRPGMGEVMNLARGHHVHAVIVAKVDRWGRSIQDLARTVDELHELGVGFFVVDQGLNVRKGDPTSKLVLNVLGSCAEWEASIISERTKEALEGREDLGRPPKRCWLCSGDRRGNAKRAKVFGEGRPLCAGCEELAPDRRRDVARAKGLVRDG